MRDHTFLGPLTLLSGAHDRGQGMCAMEAAAYLAGEAHSDHPECVSPVIATFMRSWNDSLSNDERQLLKPWIPRVLHTRTTAADEEARAWLALDWLVRVQMPAWLDLAGLTDHAMKVRALPALLSAAIATACQPTLDAAWAAAGTAAGAAAGDAAWAAAGAAARDAATQRLAPTIKQLQESAFDLLERMIAVGTCVEPGCAKAEMVAVR